MKIAILGVILLVIGLTQSVIASPNPQRNSPLNSNNILYVGGTGSGNYTHIQDAINNTSNGDTIYVFNHSSPYIEKLNIEKSITLIGEDQVSTFINAPSNQFIESVIVINAPNVSIKGFTINLDVFGITVSSDHAALINLTILGNGSSGIRLLHAHNVTISHISVYWTNIGFETWDNSSSNTIIDHCQFFNCNTGILIDSSNNIIQSNAIMGNSGFGITLHGSQNQILNNTIKALNADSTKGIYIDNKNNVIKGNQLIKSSFVLASLCENIFINNTVNGKPFVYEVGSNNKTIDSAGQIVCINCSHMLIQDIETAFCWDSILLYQTTNSTLQNCTIIKSHEGISFDSASYNHIKGSTIIDCDIGISLHLGSYNTIENNRLSSCGMSIAANNTIILNNKINSSSKGISIGEIYNVPIYANNTLEQNSFIDCKLGLELVFCRQNTITKNDFINDTTQASFYNARQNHWTQNYWGQQIEHPKVIPGSIVFFGIFHIDHKIPWINLDLFPAKKPNTLM